VIVLDTHIWLWGAGERFRLTAEQRRILFESEEPLGLSAISLWEAAMLANRGRLDIDLPIHEWLELASRFPRMRILPLDVRIAAETVSLPEPFHRDPADRIIVATARVLGCPLMTVDAQIRAYPHVQTIA
jgi:PIN domain nuclease of toxin-antitoxin system